MLASLLLALLLQSTTTPKVAATPAPTHQAAQPMPDHPSSVPAEKSPWDKAYVLLTGGLLVVGGLQAWLFLRQLHLIRVSLADTKHAADAATIAAEAARDSVTDSRATAERELRAYVTVDNINYSGHGNNPTTVRVLNSGQTPARSVQCRAWMTWQHARLVGPFIDLRPMEASDLVLGPGQGADVYILPMTQEDYRRPPHAGWTYVHGRIDYVDVFGKRRWTTFRYESAGVSLNTHLASPDGNDADFGEPLTPE